MLRLTKRPRTHAVLAPLSGLAEAAHQATIWGHEWGVGTNQPLVRWPDLSSAPPLPTLSCHLVRAACVTFPCGTGLGWDKFHPRIVNRLPDGDLLALIRFFVLVELVGQWPATIGVVLICLLPKPDGGRRPIGLLPSFIRLWMRARSNIAREWARCNAAPSFFGGRVDDAAELSFGFLMSCNLDTNPFTLASVRKLLWP